MIQLVSQPFDRKEWTDLTLEFRDLSLPQTWEYGTAKTRIGRWSVERSIFLDGNRVVGAAQALVRRVPVLGGGLAWISRGPIWRRTATESPALFFDIIGQLRRYWVEEHRLYLRIAPPLKENEIDFRQLDACDYRPAGESDGWASAVLDLQESEEELHRGLSGNWRKQLSKAERLGVSCVTDCSLEVFDSFLDSYEGFLSERGIETSVTPALLRELRLLTPEGRGLWLVEGHLGSEHLGSLLVSGCGATCMFLALAISERGRAVHAVYVMHWEAIKTMKRLGFTQLDVGGLDPTRTPEGILQFKRGLRPVEYRLCTDLEASNDGWRDRLVRWRAHRARTRGE